MLCICVVTTPSYHFTFGLCFSLFAGFVFVSPDIQKGKYLQRKIILELINQTKILLGLIYIYNDIHNILYILYIVFILDYI